MADEFAELPFGNQQPRPNSAFDLIAQLCTVRISARPVQIAYRGISVVPSRGAPFYAHRRQSPAARRFMNLIPLINGA
jgi:hypothetical protein